MLERCLVLRRRLDNRAELAGTLSTTSLARLQVGDVNGARESEREALQIFTEVGDRRGEAIGHLHLGQIDAYVGDDHAARSHFEQCLAIAREIEHREFEGESELHLGMLALAAGDSTQGEQWFQKSLAVSREAADKRGEANAIRWLGRVASVRGDMAVAREQLTTAARAFKAFEMWEELLSCLEDVVVVSEKEGELGIAIRLSAATVSARARLHLDRSPRHERHWSAQLTRLSQASDASMFAAEWRVGIEWDVEDALSSFQARHAQQESFAHRKRTRREGAAAIARKARLATQQMGRRRGLVAASGQPPHPAKEASTCPAPERGGT